MTRDVTTEQKLRLVRQVRSRYQEDQYDMSNRERILYGRASMPPENRYVSTYRELYDEPAEPVDGAVSFFRVRLLVAVVLLAAVIFMDKSGIKVAGITTEEIFQAISADVNVQIEEWVEAVSYSLPQR